MDYGPWEGGLKLRQGNHFLLAQGTYVVYFDRALEPVLTTAAHGLGSWATLARLTLAYGV